MKENRGTREISKTHSYPYPWFLKNGLIESVPVTLNSISAARQPLH